MEGTKKTRHRCLSLKDALFTDSFEDLIPSSSRSTYFAIKTIEEFNEKYTKQHIIGEGATGKVFLGKAKATGEFVAIKEISDRILISNREIIREVSILLSLKHENIIALRDVVLTEERLFIIMELASGPELFDAICEKKNYCEKDAVKVIRELCSALAYMHSHGVCHRDLKPENILFGSEDADAPIKLVDFGLSSPAADLYSKSTGTLGYKAPEVFLAAEALKRHERVPVDGMACDMWALGVITYILLCGFPPFFSDEHFNDPDFQLNAPFWLFFNEETQCLRDQVCNCKIVFPSPSWDSVSANAKDFILHLLHQDPKTRYTARQSLGHVWLCPSSSDHDHATPLSRASSGLSRFQQKKAKLNARLSRILVIEESPPFHRAGEASHPSGPSAPTTPRKHGLPSTSTTPRKQSLSSTPSSSSKSTMRRHSLNPAIFAASASSQSPLITLPSASFSPASSYPSSPPRRDADAQDAQVLRVCGGSEEERGSGTRPDGIGNVGFPADSRESGKPGSREDARHTCKETA